MRPTISISDKHRKNKDGFWQIFREEKSEMEDPSVYDTSV